MPISAPIRFLAAAAVIAPVVAACAPPGQVPSSVPGTTPAVWTGVEHAPQGHGEKAGEKAAPQAAPIGEKLVTELKTPEGVSVATAEFVFAEGVATINVKTTQPGLLAPGFHGLHIHSVGKCEPNSVGPAGGNPGDFLSAGDPIAPASPTGPLVPLQVKADGTGMLVTTTDAFKEEQLLDGDKSAIVIYDKSETAAADAAGGVAAKRVACGVLTSG